MIKTIADLLAAFLESERKILDQDPVKHAPTIGAMYEGLTKDALAQTIPTGLTVSGGFAVNAKGEQSGQLDCILAKGSGELVPHTDLRRFRIEDIIAVVEVKKTLYGGELAEGYDQLRDVYKLGVAIGTPVLPVARRAFEQITGIVAESESEIPRELINLWALLRYESASPARILLGFHGYQSETSLRRGVLAWLNSLVGEQQSGPMSLPHLICNEHSVVVKANGMPWPGAMQGDKWPCLASSDTLSPANAFLEIIWSRLNYHGLLDSSVFGPDLELDDLHRLVDAKCGKAGWEYHVWAASVPKNTRAQESQAWCPHSVTKEQGLLILYLQKPETLNLAALPSGFPPPDEVRDDLEILREVGVVVRRAADSNQYELSEGTEMCFIPNGPTVVANNSSGRLSRWVSAYSKSHA